MGSLKHLSFAALSAFIFTSSAYATSTQTLTEVASKPQWLSMLHYSQIGVIKQEGSQIEDPAFFLSPNGQYSAEDELLATVSAFRKVDPDTELNALPQCRFPGRFAWLKNQLSDHGFVDVDCPEFDTWKDQIQAEKVYLVFPAAYLNSPSSMYGHTLFRIKKKGNNTPLLDHAVNYAANTDPADNQLVFSYKGLTGGYPGVVSVMPYYQKVKEYNFLENRDIWEYELKLSDEEVAQFVRHIWEMKRTAMPYYFFSQNCSYQLLTMLDAASPRLNLAQEFSIWAIPADTVREIKRQGVLGDASYRPSTLNKIESMLTQASHEQIEMAKHLVEPAKLDVTELEGLSPKDQAQILEIAYEYSRYLSARKKSSLKHLNGRSIKLLSLRSRLRVSNIFETVDIPLERDDQGHSTARLGLAAQQQNGEMYGILDYRPSYHDILDPQGGYLRGAELSMFSGSLRYGDKALELNHFNFVNIHSMAPTNPLMTPKSWHINASLLRDVAYNDALQFRLQGGAGVTTRLSSRSLLAGFWNGRASVDDALDKGYALETGPELKWVWNGVNSNWMASYQYLIDVNQHHGERQEASLFYSYEFAEDWQWRLGHQYTRRNQKDWGTTQWSVFHYF